MSKLADQIGIVLAEMAEQEPDIFVLDGDLADSDGAIHFAQRHPEQFLMAGIAEQSMLSVAAGMASAGRRPFVFSFAAFLCFRAYDQVRVCLSQSEQPVVMVGSHAGGLSGRNGKTHTAINDMALMLSLPKVQVWAPADHLDIAYMLPELMQSEQAAYVRAPRCPVGAGQNLPGEAGRFRWLRPKQAVTLVSCGVASQWSYQVACRLQRQGIDLGLLHCLHVNDVDGLRCQLDGAEQIFVIEDHNEFGGLASLVRQLDLPARVKGIGWPMDFSGKSGDDHEIRQAYGLSDSQLAAWLLNALQAEQGYLDLCEGEQ
ncbi:transketolase [Thalassomonas viridans]|uniref:Transketolase n=1 Tax=Thalassomonas viridans TaxID=137584 RepID=A0AAF0CE82_9GAMM|nr:transketolase C-terminal domain-containing protein [Thalassomonas viridans]WDE09271.1 transketolase [Thalassomonas viridans]